MVDEVGGLRDQARAILLDRGQNGLDRFLAQLLGAMARALIEEPARIGHLRTRFGALLHAFFKIMESKIGHQLSPPCHSTSLRYRKSRAAQPGARAALSKIRRRTRLSIEPHRQSGTGHVPLGLGDSVL